MKWRLRDENVETAIIEDEGGGNVAYIYANGGGKSLAAKLVADHNAEIEASEPITENWLASVIGRDAICTETHEEWGEAITSMEGVGEVLAPMPKTRRDFRDLCRLLGRPIQGEGE